MFRLLEECQEAVSRWSKTYANRPVKYPIWMRGELSPEMEKATADVKTQLESAWKEHQRLIKEASKSKKEKDAEILALAKASVGGRVEEGAL